MKKEFEAWWEENQSDLNVDKIEAQLIWNFAYNSGFDYAKNKATLLMLDSIKQ